MANPRRTPFSGATTGNHHHQLPTSDPIPTPTPTPTPYQTQTQILLNSVKQFLKKPHAFLLILSALLFLTWVSLRIQFQQYPQNSIPSKSVKSNQNVKRFKNDEDGLVNLVRFLGSSKRIVKDGRGWLIEPVSVALRNGILGGAVTCESAHLGEIRPGGLRGNHRHHFCNETFIIWGAATLFRLENPAVEKGYAQTTIGPDEVAVVASPIGTAHALVNVDPDRTTFFLGCQDHGVSSNTSSSDYKVWKDL